MKLEESLESAREYLGGLHQSGTALIKRGTAMGPLIPLLLLVPILIFAAWLFLEVAVIKSVPSFSALCMLGILVIVAMYLRHYGRFAKEDPDRLQSEEFRVRMEQLELQRVVAKDGLLPAEVLDPAIGNPVTENGEDDADGRNEQQEEPRA
ncbi:MAG: hypothetical protein F4229_07140 [Gammaproteobacteria bacterium]|nr:hypothetical protein [Gammaproteobacteria bacterium]MYF10746.1 hypothetical protein [Gammaproteobacteria bacterium]MYH14982.1 hypothetical protein [Gammaproteobacteria bacterium]